MMGTYTQIIYQIVFGTWNHEHTLVDKTRQELFKYIWGILKKKRCHLYRIGGVADHIHIVTHLHPTEPLASLVKDIKLAGSEFIKTNKLFPSFSGWQDACLPARQGGQILLTRPASGCDNRQFNKR